MHYSPYVSQVYVVWHWHDSVIKDLVIDSAGCPDCPLLLHELVIGSSALNGVYQCGCIVSWKVVWVLSSNTVYCEDSCCKLMFKFGDADGASGAGGGRHQRREKKRERPRWSSSVNGNQLVDYLDDACIIVYHYHSNNPYATHHYGLGDRDARNRWCHFITAAFRWNQWY